MTEKRVSDILTQVAEERTERNISVCSLLDELGSSGFGLVILIFSLPNSLPIFGIPGFSSITGIPILLLAFQLALGRDSVAFPKWVEKREFSHESLAKVIRKAMPYILGLEKVLKPRFDVLTGDAGARVIGVVIFLLGVLLALPIPFGNFFPGLAITLLAFGLLERDGVFILAGYAVGLIGLAIVWFMGKAVLKALTHAFGWLMM